MSITIKGQAGHTLDATARSTESMRIEACSVKFGSLENDELTWTARADDSKGTGTIIPDVGQVVELWSGSTRKFYGWAVAPRCGVKGVQVTVTGPWWWLKQIPISSIQADSTAATADRTSFVFPTQSLATSITSLLTRAALQSRDNPADPSTAKFTVGTIDAMFLVPKMTLSNMDFGSALAELLRWCADAVAWVDYSGTGLPSINVSRRNPAAARTYTVGTSLVEVIDISPRIDLQVSRVDLNYVARQSVTGMPVWVTEGHGTVSSGKCQIIPISGPEIVSFLPRDDFEIALVGNSDINTVARSKDPILLESSKLYPPGPEYTEGFAESLTRWYNSSGTWWPATYHFAPLIFLRDGVQINPAGYTLIAQDSLPEWAMTELGAIPVTVTGTWLATEKVISNTYWSARLDAIANGGVYGENFIASHSTQLYAWAARPFQFSGVLLATNSLYFNSVSSAAGGDPNSAYLPSAFSSVDQTYVGATVYWNRNNVPCSGRITVYEGSTRKATLNPPPGSNFPRSGDPIWLDGVPVHKAWDYDYLSPPTGLAQNLLACQSFVPYEGTVGIVGDTVSLDNDIALPLNLANCRTEYATMNAMVRSVSYDLLNMRTVWTLGTPARTDFGSLVARVRRSPQDNIVWI